MPNPIKQFTDYVKSPLLGKIGLKSPILEGYQLSANSTRGYIVEHTETDADSLDRCVVNFRGEALQATCCHPGLTAGMSVSMIEQPRGVWWATLLQKSWYSRPLYELVQKGHPAQAAVEWLLSFGDKWRPKLIIIDKRGTKPVLEYRQPDLRDGDAVGYNIDQFPYDPAYFDAMDLNGDGFVDESELRAWYAENGGMPAKIGLDGKPFFPDEPVVTEFLFHLAKDVVVAFRFPTITGSYPCEGWIEQLNVVYVNGVQTGPGISWVDRSNIDGYSVYWQTLSSLRALSPGVTLHTLRAYINPACSKPDEYIRFF